MFRINLMETSSVPVSTVYDTAVGMSSASVASEQSASSIVEIASSANAAAASSASIASVARGHTHVGAHFARFHIPAHPHGATHGEDIKTVTKTVTETVTKTMITTVGTATPNVTSATTANAPAKLPPSGVIDKSFTTHTALHDGSTVCTNNSGLFKVLFAVLVGLIFVAVLISFFTRWHKKRRSSVQKHAFYQQKPEQWLPTPELTQPQPARLAEEGAVGVKRPTLTGFNGNIVSPRKAMSLERLETIRETAR